MANIRISDLVDLTIPTGASVFPISHQGSTRKLSVDNLVNYINNISTGVDPTYATATALNVLSGSLNSSGFNLTNTINSLSGSLNLSGISLINTINSSGISLINSINSLSGSLNSSGISLTNTINSLSGLFTGYTGALDASFATDLQLSNTGSTLVSSINSLSGTLTSNYATITNLISTGSTLDGKINNLSGYVSGISLGGSLPTIFVYTTGAQTISGNKNFASRLTINGTGVLLSGEAGQVSNTVVQTTGTQNISGLKTFTDTGVFNNIQINNKLVTSYNYVTGGIFYFDNSSFSIINSSLSTTGILPSNITSGINYYVKNLNTGILTITGSGQRTIDGFLEIDLYQNDSVNLLGINNIGYTGWISTIANGGVS